MKKVEKHRKLSDDAFRSAFATQTIEPKVFTHEAHLRLAWLYVTNFEVTKAAELLCQQIKAFDLHFGKGDVYNETVTIAFAYLVQQRQKMGDYKDFEAFLAQHNDLQTNYRAILAEYYDFDVFKNETAKTEYVAPTIKGF